MTPHVPSDLLSSSAVESETESLLPMARIITELSAVVLTFQADAAEIGSSGPGIP
jgi:hypothetical protein